MTLPSESRRFSLEWWRPVSRACSFVSNKDSLLISLDPTSAFSITRFRGDEKAAAGVYKGIQPLTAEDVAEDIVWAASRKPHM